MNREREPDIRWSWTRPVFFAAEREFLAHADSPVWNRMRWLIALVPFLVLIIVFSARGGLTLATTVVVAALAFGMPWVGARIGARVQSRMRARHIERETRAEERQMVVWIEEEHFRLEWGSGKLELGWASVRRAVETPEFILLFCNRTAGYYLPKSAIQTDTENVIKRLEASLANVGLKLQRAGV